MTSPTPTAKRAKARVLYHAIDGNLAVYSPHRKGHFPVRIPGVFTPCLSGKEAEEKRKWANRSYEQKVEKMAHEIFGADAVGNTPEFAARAILALQGERP